MTLEESIIALEKLRVNACLSFYNIGKLLKQVNEDKSYVERYRTFDEFLEREGWSKEGYALIAIVETFPALESHIGKRLGYFKLRTMLPVARHASEPEKRQMLKMAEIRSCKALREALDPFRQKLHLPLINSTLSFGVCNTELRTGVLKKLEILMQSHNLHVSKVEALDLLLTELINNLDKGVIENE